VRHHLADDYRHERVQLIELGRSLSDDQAATMTTACPAWSIKDTFAHLAGVSADILAGNTEDAATEAWADAQVASRREHSLPQVLDEWERDGAAVNEIMDSNGEFFPFQLFVDQWTHGWDIRAGIGQAASAEPNLVVYETYLPDFFSSISERTPEGLAEVTLKVAGKSCALGTEPAVGELELGLFEYARVSMGRRSLAQLHALPWPDAVDDILPYVDLLVVWSVNDHDVIDPVQG